MSGQILGAVLAGGRSSRFGSDKAQAKLDGVTLLDRSTQALGTMCDTVVVVGHGDEGIATIADWPCAGMGPLSGIAAALRHAASLGYDAVLSCGVDSINLPSDLVGRLAPAPAYVESQPVIGLWSVTAAQTVEAILQEDTRKSMLAFAERIGARPQQLDLQPANINTPEDLANLERHGGL